MNPPPPQAKFECALKHLGIKIVTLDWITDSVKGNGIFAVDNAFGHYFGLLYDVLTDRMCLLYLLFPLPLYRGVY